MPIQNSPTNSKDHLQEPVPVIPDPDSSTGHPDLHIAFNATSCPVRLFLARKTVAVAPLPQSFIHQIVVKHTICGSPLVVVSKKNMFSVRFLNGHLRLNQFLRFFGCGEQTNRNGLGFPTKFFASLVLCIQLLSSADYHVRRDGILRTKIWTSLCFTLFFMIHAVYSRSFHLSCRKLL